MDLMQQLVNEVVNEKTKVVEWPEKFTNNENGREFEIRSEEIYNHIYKTDSPKHLYIRSGEGAGKTSLLSVIILNKLKRGMSGAFVCVDMPMLIKVWDEFKKWIPWECVIDDHKHMNSPSWTPYRSLFEIVFHNELGGYSKLFIGGLGDNYGKWESLSLSFFAIDEARHIPKDTIMKVAIGRIRKDGPNGEPPQLIIGSTPTDTSHWLYDWFSPEKPQDEQDDHRDFKRLSKTIYLLVSDNNKHLSKEYIQTRSVGLTEAEKTIYVDGEWADLSDDNKFVEHISIWQRLYDPKLQPVRKKNDSNKDWSDALVVGLDGAIKNDSFAMVGVTRHPNNRNDVAIRLTREFKPIHGRIDFKEVEDEIRKWCRDYNVITVVFDIYQLYDMTERLRKEGIAWFQEFSQMSKRSLSDNLIYELVLQHRIHHMNQEDLENHVRNAGTVYDSSEKKRRIVKINSNRKIDLLIATSMASFEALRLNL